MLPLLYFSCKMFKHNTDDLDSMESYNSSKQKKILKNQNKCLMTKKTKVVSKFCWVYYSSS